MTGPDSRWHKALSQSDKGFARDVMISATRKSAHDISLYGVATLKKVAEKNILVSCRTVKFQGFVTETDKVRLKTEASAPFDCCMQQRHSFCMEITAFGCALHQKLKYNEMDLTLKATSHGSSSSAKIHAYINGGCNEAA